MNVRRAAFERWVLSRRPAICSLGPDAPPQAAKRTMDGPGAVRKMGTRTSVTKPP